jgi:hypothetical protein
VFVFGIEASTHASIFRQVPFAFEDYNATELDWYDNDDTSNSGSTALGFSVSIGGATYSHFDISSDGYIELLKDGNDVPTNYGYGSIDDLINDTDYGADPNSTYLLAAYDDLSSFYNGYYGYKLHSDLAVFYYDTETYEDEDSKLLNNFEVILYSDGRVQWNFNYADYNYSSYDLFSGLYFGNTGGLFKLVRYDIPEQESHRYHVLTADLNYDFRVNLIDLSILAEQWLRCTDPDDPNCFE